MIFDEGLLAKLVCPISRTPLRFDAHRQELVSDAAELAYPVRNGTAILLIEEARSLRDGEKNDG